MADVKSVGGVEGDACGDRCRDGSRAIAFDAGSASGNDWGDVD